MRAAPAPGRRRPAGPVASGMSRQRRAARRAPSCSSPWRCRSPPPPPSSTPPTAQQAEADALLTNGADVTVTESPGAVTGPGVAARLARVPGVTAVEPLQHRFAYVGSDLQDLYGVRPARSPRRPRSRTPTSPGGDRRAGSCAPWQRRPDSVLVSAETVKDFQLQPRRPAQPAAAGRPDQRSSPRCRSTTRASSRSSRPRRRTASSSPTPPTSRSGPAATRSAPS